jgi:hypothetical protein
LEKHSLMSHHQHIHHFLSSFRARLSAKEEGFVRVLSILTD